MKRFLLILSIVSVASGQTFKRTGTSGFTFLEIPVSARNASLGETGVAGLEHGPMSLFLNPALTAFGSAEHSAGVSYAPWLADMSHYGVAYAWRGAPGMFGISATVMDYGSMTRTERTLGAREFVSLGTYSAHALSAGVSYGRQLTDRFAFGVTFKYVEERIDIYSARNVLLDGGVLYLTGFRSLRLAAAIQNFGTETAFRNDVFKMPSLLRLGAAMEMLGDVGSDYRLTTSFEALHPSDNDERFQVGVEAAWDESIMLRYGYKFLYDEENQSFGIGFRTTMGVEVEADFAYVLYGRLGDVLRFTLQMDL